MSVNLHVPSTWPFWFGRAMMLPKSKEAISIASLTSPPPWFTHLFKQAAFLPTHISAPFVNPGGSAPTVTYMGEPMDRERVYGIVRDFFKVECEVLPLEHELSSMHRAKLLEIRASAFTRTAAMRDMGPMFADLQARAVDCLNTVGDEIEHLSVFLSHVDAAIAPRPLVDPPLHPLLRSQALSPLSLRRSFPGCRVA